MRSPRSSFKFPLVFAAVYAGMSLCPAAFGQGQTAPCTPASAPNTTASTANTTTANPNTVAGAADNAKTAFKNLGSVFGKKKDAAPAGGTGASASSTAPCAPASASAGSAAPAPGSGAPGSAQPGAAASSRGDAAAPWSPDDAGAPKATPQSKPTATAFTGPLDPAKLPDVVGVHMGMPIEEALAVMKKLHGGNVNLISAGNPVNYTRVSYQLNVNPPAGETFQLDYTFPPGVQRVADISHMSQYYPPVSHANMVEGLRAKYGKETLAIAGPLVAKPGEDARITSMIWLFDENGKPVPSGPVTNLAPYGCTQDHFGTGYQTMVNASMRNALPAPTFCDSLIILNVAFTNAETVGLSQTMIIDNGLLLRSVKATGDYQTELAKKQHEQQLQQANQAKPTL